MRFAFPTYCYHKKRFAQSKKDCEFLEAFIPNPFPDHECKDSNGRCPNRFPGVSTSAEEESSKKPRGAGRKSPEQKEGRPKPRVGWERGEVCSKEERPYVNALKKLEELISGGWRSPHQPAANEVWKGFSEEDFQAIEKALPLLPPDKMPPGSDLRDHIHKAFEFFKACQEEEGQQMPLSTQVRLKLKVVKELSRLLGLCLVLLDDEERLPLEAKGPYDGNRLLDTLKEASDWAGHRLSSLETLSKSLNRSSFASLVERVSDPHVKTFFQEALNNTLEISEEKELCSELASLIQKMGSKTYLKAFFGETWERQRIDRAAKDAGWIAMAAAEELARFKTKTGRPKESENRHHLIHSLVWVFEKATGLDAKRNIKGQPRGAQHHFIKTCLEKAGLPVKSNHALDSEIRRVIEARRKSPQEQK